MNIFLSAFVLLYFVGEKCCLQKLKERKKFLRSSSLEMQGHILRASGDRAKAQGQHNAEGGLRKIPYKLCCSEYRHNAEGGLEKCPLPIYVAVEQILTHHLINNPLSKD